MRPVIRPAVAAAVVTLLFVPAPPASAEATRPAAPTKVSATNDAASITLAWIQPATGTRPRSFRVYEGSAVVARNTTTFVKVANLGFNTVHTFTVTAVDEHGRESAHSAPVTRRIAIPGTPPCFPSPPAGLAATAVSHSAVTLSWDPPTTPGGFLLLGRPGRGGPQFTEETSVRVGGLAPATTYPFVIRRLDCLGRPHDVTISVTTADGPAARPDQPWALSVGERTSSTISLSWEPSGDPGVRYDVYRGGTLVASTTGTSVVVRRLWRGNGHRFTVTAVDAAGSESFHSNDAHALTLPCEPAPPAPARVRATPVGASSVALFWIAETASDEFTVFDGANAVLTTRVPSAMVTGLASGSTHPFRIVARLPNACGSTPSSRTVTATTGTGPVARPAAPTDLRVTSTTPSPGLTGRVTLGWTGLASADPAVGYRVYEGARVLATVSSPTTTVTLELASATSHFVSVTAVDAAGNESTQSAPVAFVVPFIPPP